MVSFLLKFKNILFNRKMPTYVVIITLGVVAVVGYFSHIFLNDDNPIEEAAEDYIEEKVGIDLDLSPHSKEN